MDSASLVKEEDRQVITQLVKKLLHDKPSDAIPFMYSYLKQAGAGIEQPVTPTNIEVAEMKNLRKKYDYLKSQLNDGEDSDVTEDSEQSGSEEEVKEVVKPRKQRQGVSAEVFGTHNKKEDFSPPVFQKTAEQKEALKTKLLQAFMFNALDEVELGIVLDAVEEVKVQNGEKVITEGDQGDCMYVLTEGALACSKVFAGTTEPKHLKDYVPGEGFGELALLYNAPRAATITATSDSALMKLDRGTFNHIVKDAAQRKREKYENFLQSVPILESMEPYERSKLGDAVKEECFNAGDLIIRQGDTGDNFYMISEGTAKAMKRSADGTEAEVKTYQSGHYFGERALLMNDLRAASIVATSASKCLTLNRATFKRLLGPLDVILMRNMEEYKKY